MDKKKIYALSAVLGMIVGSLGTFHVAGDSEIIDSTTNETQVNDIDAEEISSSKADVITDGFSVSADVETEIIKNEAVLLQQFADVPADSWYFPYVRKLVADGIVKGVSENTFSPDGTFTVAEAAAIITRYLGLEEQAAKRSDAMKVLSVSGSDKWYAGYIQLMFEAGIMDVEKYGCTVLGRHISIDSPELLEQPVKRYEFAAFVTRSFELDGVEIRANVGEGLGHEFILGGAYDESVLEKYIPFIKDYTAIPQSYNYYVLKAYYNGLFNGDEAGNFHPNNNLTRAEMAKVTAVIMDSSLRTPIDITQNPYPDGVPLTEASFISKHGESYLKNEVSDKFLAEASLGISVYYENNMPYVSYTPHAIPPQGYIYNFYHFTKDKSGFDIQMNAESDLSVSYKNLFSPGDRLVLALTEHETGKIADAYGAVLVGVGAIVTEDLRYLP